MSDLREAAKALLAAMTLDHDVPASEFCKEMDALQAALAADEVSVPISPDCDLVICPACCHQFRAIPLNVQKLLRDAGIEPPFMLAAHEKEPR